MSQLCGPVKKNLELTWKVNGTILTRPEDLLNHELKYLTTEVNTYHRSGDLLYSVLWNEKNKIVRNADLTYNRKGKLIHETLFYMGFGYEQKIYEYDSKGRRAKIKLFSDSQLLECTVFIYDKRGLCVRSDELNNEGELVVSMHFDYNADENMVHMEKTNENGERIADEYQYFNEENGLMKKIYCCPKEFEKNNWQKIIACYDANENKIEETWYGHNGEVYRQRIYEYEFDCFGNWISRKTFENGFLICRKERDIEYF